MSAEIPAIPEIVKEDVKIPVGDGYFIVDAGIASIILTVILVLLSWDLFRLVSKWLWRALFIAFLYLALLLGVALKRTVKQLKRMKEELKEMADSGDISGIQEMLG
tara:strand:- start:51 stop:368 length:318 start_codon:yes stop_codon:yes gene_type:complete